MTLRSAVEGVIDYSKADRYDPSWWRQWRFKIQTMYDAYDQTVLQHAFQFNLALISSSKIKPEDFGKVQQVAKELFEDLKGSIRPWTGKTKEERTKNESQQFKEDWKRITGIDTDDPEAMAEWEDSLETVSNYKSERLEAEATENAKIHQAMLDKINEISAKRLRQQQGKR